MNKEQTIVEPQRQSIRFDVGSPLVLVLGTALIGLLGVLYSDILIGLAEQWYSDRDSSHGFLVPLVSAYLIWERREKLRSLPIKSSFWGIVLLGIGLLMLLIGTFGAVIYLQRTSLIVVLMGLILLLWGPEFFRVLIFPIAFLFFMVPLPIMVMDAVAFPLQFFAAKTAAFCLFNFGIPVLREGNVIILAGTTLEVAEACSGIRSLQALLALGTLYAYFSERVMWKRWALVLLSIPIAIIANVFRVSGTGVLAHYFGAEAAEGFYHTFSGWLIFVVAFLLLLGCGSVLSKLPPTHVRPRQGEDRT
jgi:exosortase